MTIDGCSARARGFDARAESPLAPRPVRIRFCSNLLIFPDKLGRETSIRRFMRFAYSFLPGTSMTTVLLLIGIAGVSLLLHALFLWLAARGLRIAQIRYWWALLTMLAIAGFSLVLMMCAAALATIAGPPLIQTVLEMILGAAGSCLLIQWMFATSLWKAIPAWLATLLAGAVALALVFLLIRPYVVEAFIMPTNSMAPTFLGMHQARKCPHCGSTLIVPYSPEAAGMSSDSAPEVVGVCERCFQATRVRVDRTLKIYGEDRFLCNKLLSPRRWDLICFRSLENPQVKYVKRLVGLPEEELQIKDGAIWINGS